MLTINENASQKSGNLKKILAAVSSVAIIGIGATYLVSEGASSNHSKSNLSNMLSDDFHGDFRYYYDSFMVEDLPYQSKGNFAKSLDENGEWDLEYFVDAERNQVKNQNSHLWKHRYILQDGQHYERTYNQTYSCAPLHTNIGYANYKYNLINAKELDVSMITNRNQERVAKVCKDDFETFIVENEDVGRLIVCAKKSGDRTTVGVVAETFMATMNIIDGKGHISYPKETNFNMVEIGEGCENSDKFLSQSDTIKDDHPEYDDGTVSNITPLMIAEFDNFPFEKNYAALRQLKLAPQSVNLGGNVAVKGDKPKGTHGVDDYVPENGEDYWAAPNDLDFSDDGNWLEALDCKGPCPTHPPTLSPTPNPTIKTPDFSKQCHLFHGANSHKGQIMQYQSGQLVVNPHSDPNNYDGGGANTRTWTAHWDFPVPSGLVYTGFHPESFWDQLNPLSGNFGISSVVQGVAAGFVGGIGVIPTGNKNWGGKLMQGDYDIENNYTSGDSNIYGMNDAHPLDPCPNVTFGEMNTAQHSYKTHASKLAIALQMCGTNQCTVGTNVPTNIFAHSMGTMIVMASLCQGYFVKGPRTIINFMAAPLLGSIAADYTKHVCNELNDYGDGMLAVIMATFNLGGALVGLAAVLALLIASVLTSTLPRPLVKLGMIVSGVCNNERTGGAKCNMDLRLGQPRYEYTDLALYNDNGIIDHKYCGLSPDGLEGFGFLWRATVKTQCMKDDFCLQMRCTTHTSYHCHFRGCTPPGGWNQPSGLRKCRRSTNVLWSRWQPRSDNNVSQFTCLSKPDVPGASNINYSNYWGQQNVQSGFSVTYGQVSHQGIKCKYGNGTSLSKRPCSWMLLMAGLTA